MQTLNVFLLVSMKIKLCWLFYLVKAVDTDIEASKATEHWLPSLVVNCYVGGPIS